MSGAFLIDIDNRCRSRIYKARERLSPNVYYRLVN